MIISKNIKSHHQDGTAITGEFYPSQTPRKPVRDTGKQMGIETILLNFNQWNLLKKFDALPKPATSDLGDPEMEIEEINLNAWKNYDGDSCSWESLRRICRYKVLMFSLVLTKERKTFLSEILFLGFYCLISSIIIYIIYYNI